MMAMGVRSRSLLVTALLVLVGSGAAKTITVDWDAAAGQTLAAENGDWIEFKSASSSGWGRWNGGCLLYTSPSPRD